MLVEERFSEILRVLDQQETATVQDLTNLLGVSESTIRRDLTQMNKRGLLKKVHGGAASIRINHITANRVSAVRALENTDTKQRLAQYAASLISQEDFVFIDSGTTADLLIDALTVTNCHFVTNNISSAPKLAMSGNHVDVLGGTLDPTISATIGIDTYYELKKYNFTLGFFGVNGIHPRNGFSTPYSADAMVKQEAIQRCKKSYIIADPTKFDSIANVTFAMLSDATIITTKVPDKSWHSVASIIETDVLLNE